MIQPGWLNRVPPIWDPDLVPVPNSSPSNSLVTTCQGPHSTAFQESSRSVGCPEFGSSVQGYAMNVEETLGYRGCELWNYVELTEANDDQASNQGLTG